MGTPRAVSIIPRMTRTTRQSIPRRGHVRFAGLTNRSYQSYCRAIHVFFMFLELHNLAMPRDPHEFEVSVGEFVNLFFCTTTITRFHVVPSSSRQFAGLCPTCTHTYGQVTSSAGIGGEHYSAAELFLFMQKCSRRRHAQHFSRERLV